MDPSLLQEINQGLQMGVCSKTLDAGDVAWKCLDCEQDPTSIICAQCFELSDHKGHRVELKRNVGGCCDCGDPEAWDQRGSCPNHQGQHAVDPQKAIDNLPEQFRNTAKSVFKSVIHQLRKKCKNLLNYQISYLETTMTEDDFKDTMVQSIRMIFEFLNGKIKECPTYIHIIDLYINEVIIDRKKENSICIPRFFLDQDFLQKMDYESELALHPDESNTCSFTAVDLCFQSNYHLDDQTRVLVYDFFFKMFQSYHTKQCLAISYAANYQLIRKRTKNIQQGDLSMIGVQVLTSDDLSMLIFKRPQLRECMLGTLEQQVQHVCEDPSDRQNAVRLSYILHDFRYMARPECLKYCISQTHWIEKLIGIFEKFYFVDIKRQRTTMVQYAQEGQPNVILINLEDYAVKLLIFYLKEVDVSDLNKNRSIFKAFSNAFTQIHERHQELDLDNGKYNQSLFGIFNMPLHRAFTYFITRFLLLNRFDKKSQFYQCQNSQILKAIATNQGQFDQEESRENERIRALLWRILDCLTQKISFVHEIQAGKWVYYGFYLQQYPRKYYALQERGSLQDLALMQIILTCDATLIDYVIDNFGMDMQLHTLFKGLKNREIAKIKFTQFQQFDPSKMRLELLSFLRFFAQVSINEVAFLKQIFNRKFDTDSEKNTNKVEIEEMWTKAVRREATHLLLLTKVNTGIREIKEKMSEMFQTDQIFEKMLFEVSEQQRDVKNQVTFKLKDSNYKNFDPYLYNIPDQQSQIYKMYEQNNLKDKFLEEGFNDIVGDYLDNYQFATNVNGEIQLNLANSQMLQIICPLLVNWLKFKDLKVDDLKKQGQQVIQQFISRVNFFSTSLRPTSMMRTFKDANLPIIDYISPDILYTMYDETFLHEIVDANVGYSCLKLLVIILKSVNKFIPEDKRSWHAKQFRANDNELVRLMINFINQANVDVKMKKLLEFILDHIIQLDKRAFDFIKLSENKQESNSKGEETKQSEKQSIDKTKKKKNKLLSKMKKGAAKYLNTNQKEEDVQKKDVESKDESEIMECAFCTKELNKSNFIESPFGNFGYVQGTKVYYHACTQTIKSQKAALKNTKLSSQFEEEEKSSQKLPGQEHAQIPQGTKQYKLEKLEMVNELCGGDGGFLNHYTGAGCVVNNCKHYAHVSCLRDYLQQQLTVTSAESLENLKLSGFNQGEFACPLCKGISNTLIPTYSIDQIYPNKSQLTHTLDSNTKTVLDFYADYFSEIIIKQQGFLSIEAQGGQANVRLLERSIVLKDIKADPQRFLKGISQYMTHLVNLIDVKGMAAFPSRKLRQMHESIKQVVQMVLMAKHSVLDSIEQDKQSLDEILFEMLEKLCKRSEKQFFYDSNFTGNFAIEFIILLGLLSKNAQKQQEMLNFVLQRICKIVRFQVMIAAVFRCNYGQLNKDITQNLSLNNLVELEIKSQTQSDLQDMLVDIELPAMRKIFAACSIINNHFDINFVLKSQSNQEELQILRQSLGLNDQTILLNQQAEQISIPDDLKQIIPQILCKHQDSQIHEALVSNLSEQDQNNILIMPNNLLLMVPSFELSFIDLPKSYTDLQKEFYKRPCFYCKREVWDSATCLLTGRTMCWFNQEIEPCKIGPSGQQHIEEGLLSWYSRVSEGSCGIFLHTSTGYMVIIQNGSCTLYDSPYRNKYGEIVNFRDKRYEDYNIDSYCLDQLRTKYLSFQIANEILQSRTNPDSKFTVFLKNFL